MTDLEKIMSARAAAAVVLSITAEPWVMKIAEDLYNNGKAAWVWDPEVQNVVGLVKTDGSNDAWMVIYLTEHDFETSDEFDACVPGYMQ